MYCPKCESQCAVIDSRQEKNNVTRRRHLCTGENCRYKFSTYEILAETKRELEDKLRRSAEARRIVREFLASLDKLL